MVSIHRKNDINEMRKGNPESRYLKSFEDLSGNSARKTTKYCSQPKEDQISDNSYIVFVLNGRTKFGRILNVKEDFITVDVYHGKNMIHSILEDMDGEPDVRRLLSCFLSHGTFDIFLKKS